MATMKDYAVAYVNKFHAVISIGAWAFTGRDGTEVDMWKRPLLKNWTEKPLINAQMVRTEWAEYEYWRRTPGIGLVTGQICGGYIVIDLDRHKEGQDGYEYLLDWQRKTGKRIPEETWTAITGSGGYHLYFHTDKAMRSFSNGSIGVDLRADGGMVVLPPSLHPNGNRYRWEISPNDCECAEADEAVMEFIEYCRPAGSQFIPSVRRGEGGARKMAVPPEIPEGNRRETLISLIGTMNRLGVSDEAIVDLVRNENGLKCKPPMTEKELQQEIFPAIYRWEKGVSEEKWVEKEQWKQEFKQQMRTEKALMRSQNNRP